MKIDSWDPEDEFLFDESENEIYDEAVGPARWTRTYVPGEWSLNEGVIWS